LLKVGPKLPSTTCRSLISLVGASRKQQNAGQMLLDLSAMLRYTTETGTVPYKCG